MVEETGKAQESIARTAEEVARRLSNNPEELAESLANIVENLRRSREHHVLAHVGSKGYLTITMYYDPPPAADYEVLVCAPKSIREGRTESQVENLSAAEQEGASTLINLALAELDEIIYRMQIDREEIDRLKEETRSNISELQRMIAA
jgi:hypothetical protein